MKSLPIVSNFWVTRHDDRVAMQMAITWQQMNTSLTAANPARGRGQSKKSPFKSDVAHATYYLTRRAYRGHERYSRPTTETQATVLRGFVVPGLFRHHHRRRRGTLLARYRQVDATAR